MPPHRPIDEKMIAAFWRGVAHARVTGAAIAAHVDLDASAISRMRTQQSPTPIDVALHILELTGPRPVIPVLAEVGLEVIQHRPLPVPDLTDSSIELVAISAELARAAHDASPRRLLEHIDTAAALLRQMRVAALLRRAS